LGTVPSKTMEVLRLIYRVGVTIRGHVMYV
jgi:hypothetical protein